MIDHARFEAAATTREPQPAEDRSMRLLEWAMAGLALVAALALTFLR